MLCLLFVSFVPFVDILHQSQLVVRYERHNRSKARLHYHVETEFFSVSFNSGSGFHLIFLVCSLILIITSIDWLHNYCIIPLVQFMLRALRRLYVRVFSVYAMLCYVLVLCCIEFTFKILLKTHLQMAL